MTDNQPVSCTPTLILLVDVKLEVMANCDGRVGISAAKKDDRMTALLSSLFTCFLSGVATMQ
jgi:hypothetical protein